MSNQPQYTPGPWTSEDRGVVYGATNAHSSLVASVFPCVEKDQEGKFTIDPYAKEREANTRLISSAPELYTSLNELRKWLENTAAFDDDEYSSDYDRALAKTAKRALAAIAKAEGSN